ncbi:MAG: DUF3347 domain-containing protein [Bdellovibrionales bacterium]|jgi:hypothetical protein|nr:DUF3347 domain-containing protein [Bdellovibrionales bacterium]MBT3527238.1 DUF3347 domain-containing protein [Bdellovibrionales bacterium]MBT7670620.1 DUF3347 domain-containing protein [Bdellovibrionales bacterium]MBT7767607.1 DUF3347 domain-containing protein [Bdellovibrionales bacterium]
MSIINTINLFAVTALLTTTLTSRVWGMEGHNQHAGMKMDQKKHSTATSGRERLDKKTAQEIIAVLKANEGLHWSFFKYDGAKVEMAAKAVKQNISQIGDPKIAGRLEFSGKKLDEIKLANGRKHNNQLYHLVSMALIHLVKKYDLGSNYNVYSCPMVKKQWIQNSSKLSRVNNPYSSAMPHCGVQESKF